MLLPLKLARMTVLDGSTETTVIHPLVQSLPMMPFTTDSRLLDYRCAAGDEKGQNCDPLSGTRLDEDEARHGKKLCTDEKIEIAFSI